MVIRPKEIRKATRSWQYCLSFPSADQPSPTFLLHLKQIYRHGRSTTACQSGRPYSRSQRTLDLQHGSQKEEFWLQLHRCAACAGWHTLAQLRIELLCHFLISDLGLATLVLQACCCCFLACMSHSPTTPPRNKPTDEHKNREDHSTSPTRN